MGFWIRGKIPAETSNPLNRLLIKAYHPLLIKVLRWPKTTLLVAALSIFTVIWPLSQVGGEFLPKINEGDLLYMPSTLPGVSPAEAAALLQTTDKLIKTVPEVASVLAKRVRPKRQRIPRRSKWWKPRFSSNLRISGGPA
jgi:Cu(I)/Ag(I) efflux system membrane protein CusA/SilA